MEQEEATGAGLNFPGVQNSHLSARSSEECWPASQLVQLESPMLLYLPEPQALRRE